MKVFNRGMTQSELYYYKFNLAAPKLITLFLDLGIPLKVYWLPVDA